MEIGASRETCQKLNIIIGRVSVIADSVIEKLSLIDNISGKNENILWKKSFVYKIHNTAKKLNWKLTS